MGIERESKSVSIYFSHNVYVQLYNKDYTNVSRGLEQQSDDF